MERQLIVALCRYLPLLFSAVCIVFALSSVGSEPQALVWVAVAVALALPIAGEFVARRCEVARDLDRPWLVAGCAALLLAVGAAIPQVARALIWDDTTNLDGSYPTNRCPMFRSEPSPPARLATPVAQDRYERDMREYRGERTMYRHCMEAYIRAGQRDIEQIRRSITTAEAVMQLNLRDR